MIAGWMVVHGERAARTAGQAIGVLGLLALIAALSLLAACSAGPQLPVVTTPITITCSWTAAPDGGHLEDNDCMVDRATSSSAAETTGNRMRDVTVSPSTSVSAIPGVGQ